MSDGDRLWQGILDEPADDDLRLVYADWLEDHDEAERAGFLRAQVELAKLDEADPRYPEVLARGRRCATFATSPTVPWRDHIPGVAVAFRRGTIFRATVEPEKYLQYPAESWQSVPLEELILWRPDDAASGEALARRPELARLRRLGFSCWYTDPVREVLTGENAPTGLRDLLLEYLFWNEDEGPEALADLARALDLPALEGLCWLHADPVSWDRFVLPLRRPLRRLAIETYSDPELPDDAEGTGRLPGSPHGPELRRVGLYHHINTISYSSVYITPRWPNVPRVLRVCPVEDLRLNVFDLPELAALPSWGNLHTLRLGHGDLTDDLDPLVAAPQAAGLRRLILDYPEPPWIEIGQPRPDVLSGPNLAGLRHLRIDGYGNTPEDLDGLAASAFREGLVRLELSRYGGSLDADGVTRLLARPWPRLHTLRLPLADPEALAPILTIPHLPALCTLILANWPKLTEAHYAELARARHLPHLSLVVEDQNEWLLSGGEARKVAEDIWLLDRDVYETGPYKSA